MACRVCDDAQLYCYEYLGQDDDEPIRLWPQTRQLPSSVPVPVRHDWSEATACFEAGAFAATSVMVRRTLEGVCKAKGVKERSLSSALKAMELQGHIDANLAKWGHMLREIGNAGAHHTGKRVPKDDAAEALDFAEAFIDYVFVLRARYDAYVERRDGTVVPSVFGLTPDAQAPGEVDEPSAPQT